VAVAAFDIYLAVLPIQKRFSLVRTTSHLDVQAWLHSGVVKLRFSISTSMARLEAQARSQWFLC
jgi:hypothetical protein